MIIDSTSGMVLDLGAAQLQDGFYLCSGVLYPVASCSSVDITIPSYVVPGQWTYSNSSFAKLKIATTADQRNQALRGIDADVDSIYGQVMGNRASEYALAEADANSYKLAGYAGTVPASVADWATVKAKSNQWAAGDILATAAAWRSAQLSIRSNRLARKEDVRNAAGTDDLATALASWAGFVSNLKQTLGISNG
jgi:hypothetical protein